MSFDLKTLLSLLDFRDDLGVLSFYCGITPGQSGDPQPSWPIEIRNRIRDLRQRVKDELDHDTWRAVHARLDGLDGELDRFLDPKAHGRGRALFVAVSDGRTERVNVQVPFRERVILEDTAFVRPLVAAYDEGRPAGIAVVHRSGTRLLEWRFGVTEELTTSQFAFGDAQMAGQKRGPSPAAPQIEGSGVNHKERFEERLDENRRRFVRDWAKQLSERVNGHGWDRLVIAGEPRTRQTLAEALPASNGLEVLTADHLWEEETPAQVSEQAWPILRSVHLERERRLVEQARDGALSGGAGALGLDEVLAALNEGRVRHLLFTHDLEVTGYRAPDHGDLLYAEVDGPAEQTGYELVEEPILVERMIEKAVATSAAITPVDEEAAEAIEDHDGVAALLRW